MERDRGVLKRERRLLKRAGGVLERGRRVLRREGGVLCGERVLKMEVGV